MDHDVAALVGPFDVGHGILLEFVRIVHPGKPARSSGPKQRVRGARAPVQRGAIYVLVDRPCFAVRGSATCEESMNTAETYLERAADCRHDAEQTNLPNVREQCLRAAAAWESMAERLHLSQEYREGEAARKAAEPLWRSAPRPHRPSTI